MKKSEITGKYLQGLGNGALMSECADHGRTMQPEELSKANIALALETGLQVAILNRALGFDSQEGVVGTVDPVKAQHKALVTMYQQVTIDDRPFVSDEREAERMVTDLESAASRQAYDYAQQVRAAEDRLKRSGR